ncbi:MAG: hypothetical protein QF415_06170 [Candidatus Undinarchaeales archaeon]|nr:hypothetical protein [Candidatus Undinarchaeales archaeon]MDP7492489.1 hypothetical protein [Candidatus Undinarchaeales archaeon]
MRRRRGQAMMLGLMAVALAIIMTMYMMSQGTEVDRDTRIERQETAVTRDTLIDVQAMVASVLDEAVAESALEIAAHGGFPTGMAPRQSVNGVPYLFYRGAVVNLPTVEAVEAMLARRVEALVGDALTTMDLGTGVEVGAPTVTARIAPEELEVDLDMPYTVVGKEAVARETASVSHAYSLRLGLLIKTARAFLHAYDQNRTMEGTLLTGLINDERVPSPPGMVSGTVACSSRTVLRERDQLIGPVRDNVRLAVARAMALANDGLPDASLEWDHSLTELAVNFTMFANAGLEDYESTKEIILVPTAMPLTDVASDQCMGRYTVSYNVDFPVRLVLRDLNKASQVVGASGTDLSQPLELMLYMRPLLVGENITIKEDHGLPTEIDDPCAGPCALDITIQDSQAGSVNVDACSFPYTDGHLVKDGVPCGVHTITIGSTEPTGLARTTLERNIHETLSETVAMQSFGSMAGRVYLNHTVLCTTDRRVEERDREPLGYVEGTPDRYMEVLFAPLGPGPLLRAIADEEGRYSIKRAEPGRYLRIARPSRDEAGAPTHMVQVAASLVEIGSGENPDRDIIVQPLLMERIGEIYVPVAVHDDKC